MDARERFSNRVRDYVDYRPGYPPELLGLLQSTLGLDPSWVIVDVGSGTGIFTQLLLRNGNNVFAVEPNREMRQAAEQLLAAYPTFYSVAGSAEDTTLEPASVDLVTAAQSFHWFDADKAREEWRRILRPGGSVALVWNERRTDTTPFLLAYDALLHTLGDDYAQVDHRNIDAVRLGAFFGPRGYHSASFANAQELDWEGLRGRAGSTSYVPAPGHAKHRAFFDGLARVFSEHASGGLVRFDYDTRIYYGALS